MAYEERIGKNCKAVYDEETKETTVTIVTDGREFVGKAKCHPEDYEYGNKITGIDIAHGKAMIKALSYKRDKARSAYEALEAFKNSLPNKLKENKALWYRLEGAVEEVKAEFELFKDIRDNHYENLCFHIKTKDSLYRKLNHKKEEKELEV